MFFIGWLVFHVQKFGLVAYLEGETRGRLCRYQRQPKDYQAKLPGSVPIFQPSSANTASSMMGEETGTTFSTCITSMVIIFALQSIYVGSKNSFPMIVESHSLALWAWSCTDGKERGDVLWRTMLSNIYLLPHLLGRRFNELRCGTHQMGRASLYGRNSREVLAALWWRETWIREAFHSEPFQKGFEAHMRLKRP